MTQQGQEEVRVGDDVVILWGNVKIITPALDCNPDETLLLTVPMPGIRTTVDKKGNPEQKGEMVLCTLTDKPEIFEACQHEFMKRGWLAQIPNPILEQRWDADSVRAFLEGRTPAVNPWEVYVAVRSKFDHYVDFANMKNGPTVCAVYTVASYFYFLFEYFPYLKFGGEKGSGKTKTGNIFAALAFNGQIFANASRAVIYRTAQDTRGTMVIDEGESLAYKSEEQAAYMQVLNSGWQRNGYAILSDKETLKPTKWSTYCPKIVCSIGGLEEVLGDRAFEIILLRTLNKEKADREVSLTSKEWQPIRDLEYLCLMQHWREMSHLIPTVTNTFEFSGRIWNLAKPLLATARLLDCYRPKDSRGVEAEIQDFVKQQAKEKVVKAAESFAFVVLSALGDIVRDSLKSGTLDASTNPHLRIELSDLRDRVREAEGNPELGSKRIATTLKNLELYKDIKRDGRKGGFRFEVTPSEILEVESRLLGKVSPTEETERPEGTEGETHTPEGSAADLGVSKSPSGGSEHSGSSVASLAQRNSSVDSSVASSEPSVDTGLCAVCGKEGGRPRISPGTGVIYLHPDCERDWRGAL
jgi:hypothetical protein